MSFNENDNQPPKVVILRGLPGAGKSTWIALNLLNALVVSADHFFMKTGKYAFNRALLGAAHNECQSRFFDAISLRAPLVVVDNCNLTARDMRFYVIHALSHNYELEIVSLQTPADVAIKRGLHSVPASAYDLLVNRYKDPLPAEWQKYERVE